MIDAKCWCLHEYLMVLKSLPETRMGIFVYWSPASSWYVHGCQFSLLSRGRKPERWWWCKASFLWWRALYRRNIRTGLCNADLAFYVDSYILQRKLLLEYPNSFSFHITHSTVTFWLPDYCAEDWTKLSTWPWGSVTYYWSCLSCFKWTR